MALFDDAADQSPDDDRTQSGRQMDEYELKSILASELANALGAEGGKLSNDRRKNLEYYNGELFGNEQEARSQVVSRNVMEAVEWVLPSLMRLFTASDTLCEFTPTRPGDEAMAAQATQYINYIILRDNPGFMVLHDLMKTSLIQKMGYCQCYWDEQRTSSTNHFSGLSDQEFIALTQSDDVEIIHDHVYPNPDPNSVWFTQDDPAPHVPQLHDCVLRVWQTEGRVKIESVAPEEILVSRRAPSTALDGKHFVCRRTLKRVTDLRQMGFAEDLIQQAMGFNEHEFNTERVARFESEDDWPLGGGDRIDPAMREVWLEDSYLSIDFDGDGIAELRRIITAANGAVIFSNETVDEVPIISLCPIPMPHKHVGMGLADLVMDLQEIKSTLLRQTLDSLYLSIAPRVIVSEMAATDETYDDLLTVRPGGIVRVADIQGIQPLTVPFVGEAALPVIEYLDQTQEIRTGVSRQNQSLGPDDLNKYASGTAINLAQQSAAQRVEMIARVFAETGIKELCRRVLGLVIRHQQQARVIRLTGQWVPFDPRSWANNMDVNVSVGLGTGNRDQVVAHLAQFLQIQQQIVATQKGVSGPLVNAENIFATLQKLQENTGFKGSPFFTDPRTAPPTPHQPQPDPEMMKAQAQAQAIQLRTQAEIQAEQAKQRFEEQQQERQFQLEMRRDQQRFDQQMALERQREAAKSALEAQRMQVQLSRAQTQGQGVPPIPGARQGRDGRHYVPDPNRPGKFMMIV